MWLLRYFPGLISRLVFIVTFFWRADCSPISTRAIDSFVSVDPSPDAWAESLSGIGPLILLIGERVTKQLLRNIHGAADAFSLAAAPLGLLSVVTSLIRCCGIQRLRAFIGYELEARAVAAIEMTRVNCGGVHAEIVDGYIVRSAAANPASQAIAVSMLRGSMRNLGDEALLQIRLCEAFENEKSVEGVPDSVAAAQWVLHIVSTSKVDTLSVIRALIQAVGGDSAGGTGDDTIRAFCLSLANSPKDMVESNYDDKSRSDEISPAVQNLEESSELYAVGEGTEKQYGTCVLVREATSETLKDIISVGIDAETLAPSSIQISRPNDGGVQMPILTFMYTLNAVSEFTTTSLVSRPLTMLLGLTSFLAILVIYILALWQNKWLFSVGWLLAFIGYVGIVLTVMSAALLIHSSCACIKLGSRSASNPKHWTDGLVVAVKNTDSMDTRGSKFMTSRCRAQHFEVVWMKDLTQQRKILASGVAMALVLSFICHYLGLRSSTWWVAVLELLVCLVAAACRSGTKDRQQKFSLDEKVRIDKRCTSTGIIETQQCQLIEKRLRNPERMDARGYSMLSPGHTPASGESIAWHIAKLCLQDKIVAAKVLDLTGMRVLVMKDDPAAETCAILVSYTGGLMVTEGLAYPNARICLAFRTRIADLALPSTLLARGIMRQPEWFLEDAEIGKGIPIGDVYVSSITSIMDWWSLSEDRNDFGDLQKNMQWCFVLINAAFFISLLRVREQEGLEISGIEDAHGKLSESNETVAENFVQFFRERSSRG